MSRYPHTEAYDAIRAVTEWKSGQGITFSRSEAAQVVKFIAQSINISPEELVKKIADYARAEECKP